MPLNKKEIIYIINYSQSRRWVFGISWKPEITLDCNCCHPHQYSLKIVSLAKIKYKNFQYKKYRIIERDAMIYLYIILKCVEKIN